MKTKKLLTAILLMCIGTLQVTQSQECVSCNNNNTNFQNYSSAVGQQNTSTGLASFVAGSNSIADADYSIAIGTSSEARSWFAVALGTNALAYGTNSFAIGGHIKATDSYGMVIGKGFDYTNKLINNIPYSLMVGFKSTKPTFFIGESPMNDKTGKVGIGDITDPQAKLHIKNDLGEYAALRVEPWSWTSDNYAEIQFGDNYNTIRGTCDAGLGFYTPNNFIFHTGNIGVGATPTEKLEVAGNIKTTGFQLTSNSSAGKLFQSDNSGFASWEDPAWNINGSNVYRTEGNVGIMTGNPAAALHIAQGDIYIQDIGSGIIMKSPDGKCWRGTLNNNGELLFSETDCPEGSASVPYPAPEKKWKIYPNPANERIFIENTGKGYSSCRVEITNVSGITLISEAIGRQKQALTVKSLPSGYYTVTVINEKGTVEASQKIMVANHQ